MKVEIKDARVELEAAAGRYHLVVNGALIPIPRDIGVALVFGDPPAPKLLPPSTTTEKRVEAVTRKKGCQTAAAKRKLSASLKKWHRKKRAEARKAERVAAKKPGIHKAKTSNYKLNGAAHHAPN